MVRNEFEKPGLRVPRFISTLKKKKTIYWRSWVFVAACRLACRLSLVAAIGGQSSRSAQASLWCFSCCRAQALGHTGFSSCAHGLSCPMACGIFPDQGSNPCPLKRQVDS